LQEDLAVYLACWAEDMTFSSPLHDPPLEGRGAYAALVEQSATHVQPLRFDVHHVAAVGDVVLAEWTITVVQRANGEPLVWDGMSRAQYCDGLITRWREYWDPAALAPVAVEAP
jgi:ketosteroid isomerase-like protein